MQINNTKKQKVLRRIKRTSNIYLTWCEYETLLIECHATKEIQRSPMDLDCI